MKITCTVDKGGCGQKFEMTTELLEDYRQREHDNVGGGCPNEDCGRVLSPEMLETLIQMVEAKLRKDDKAQKVVEDRWPGFPLKTPVIPSGRRKNGAAPGVCFKKISETDADRSPTPEEILRVQRFFASNLDKGTDCPCCTRHAKRQLRPLGCGPARWLIEIVYLSDEGQAIHTGTVLKSLKGKNISGSDATSVLPLYGLIEPAKDPNAGTNPPPPSSRAHAKGRTSGFWKPTKLGRAFALDKIQVPAKVVTCLGVPEAFDGDLISIKDAIGKKFNYDEIMGRKTT